MSSSQRFRAFSEGKTDAVSTAFDLVLQVRLGSQRFQRRAAAQSVGRELCGGGGGRVRHGGGALSGAAVAIWGQSLGTARRARWPSDALAPALSCCRARCSPVSRSFFCSCPQNQLCLIKFCRWRVCRCPRCGAPISLSAGSARRTLSCPPSSCTERETRCVLSLLICRHVFEQQTNKGDFCGARKTNV
jgi:hypothetical protein